MNEYRTQLHIRHSKLSNTKQTSVTLLNGPGCLSKYLDLINVTKIWVWVYTWSKRDWTVEDVPSSVILGLHFNLNDPLEMNDPPISGRINRNIDSNSRYIPRYPIIRKILKLCAVINKIILIYFILTNAPIFNMFKYLRSTIRSTIYYYHLLFSWNMHSSFLLLLILFCHTTSGKN